MVRWEYQIMRVVDFSGEIGKPDGQETVLARMGFDGWELVSNILKKPLFGLEHYEMLFRRELPINDALKQTQLLNEKVIEATELLGEIAKRIAAR